MEANRGSSASSHGYQALSMEAEQLSFPLEGKRQCCPSYLSRTYFKLCFFPIALHHFGFLSLPRASSSCPSTCYTVHFPLVTHLTWLPCWAKATLHHNLLPCSCLLANFCWLHRLCFRPNVNLHCNPIKPIVPDWLFLFWKSHFQWCYHFSTLRGETL